MSWRDEAACRGTDPNLWIGPPAGRPSLEAVAATQQMCVACTVRDECLTYAIESGEIGFWGGMTERQRKTERSRRRRAGTLRLLGRAV